VRGAPVSFGGPSGETKRFSSMSRMDVSASSFRGQYRRRGPSVWSHSNSTQAYTSGASSVSCSEKGVARRLGRVERLRQFHEARTGR
jgi:transposase InsO family protein